MNLSHPTKLPPTIIKTDIKPYLKVKRLKICTDQTIEAVYEEDENDGGLLVVQLVRGAGATEAELQDLAEQQGEVIWCSLEGLGDNTDAQHKCLSSNVYNLRLRCVQFSTKIGVHDIFDINVNIQNRFVVVTK